MITKDQTLQDIKNVISTMSDKQFFKKLDEFYIFLDSLEKENDGKDMGEKLMDSIDTMRVIEILKDELDRREVINREKMKQAYDNLSDEEKEMVRQMEE